ncbi:hypothetical protein ABZ760_30195, partial [Streptomyces sp. NPDC006658]
MVVGDGPSGGALTGVVAGGVVPVAVGGAETLRVSPGVAVFVDVGVADGGVADGAAGGRDGGSDGEATTPPTLACELHSLPAILHK